MTEETQSEILICDDMVSNLKQLSALLGAEGHRVRVAVGGEAAIKAVRHKVPDLVLMDIVMPDLDGYETCSRIHSLQGAEALPVIFISGLTNTDHKVQAFNSGGVDYITKPFEPEEVRARVANQLRISALRRALEARNREVTQAYGRLEELQRMQESLTNLVVHDMRTPLAGASMALELLALDAQLSGEQEADLGTARSAVKVLSGLVNDLLTVVKLEAAEMPLNLEPSDFTTLWSEVCAALGALEHEGQLHLSTEEGLGFLGDRGLLCRTLVNLIHNAIKHSPSGTQVHVRAAAEGANLRVEVQDFGDGIEERFWDRIFEKFGQATVRAEAARHSTGLGLTFCKLAVEAHGGTIGVRSKVGEGSTFWFAIPISGPAGETATLSQA